MPATPNAVGSIPNSAWISGWAMPVTASVDSAGGTNGL